MATRPQACHPGAGMEANREYITRWLPRRGHRWVAEKIGAKPANLWAWADNRDIRFGDLPGMIRISELAALVGVHSSTIWARAKREGVMVKVGPPKARRAKASLCLVPSKWADAVIVEYQRLDEGSELQEEAGWLTVTECVRAWKVGRGTIQRGLTGTGVLAPLLAGVRVVRGRSHNTRGKYLVNPWDAEAVRRRLEEDRVQARKLVSTKSLAVELGVALSTAAYHGKRLGGVSLFVSGRHMIFVTHEAADQLRGQYGVRRAA